MNVRGTSLLVIALVFTLTTTAISQAIGTSGIIGLFYGILPRKEFRILFLVGIISLCGGLLNMGTFLYSTYSGVNIQNMASATTNNINIGSGGGTGGSSGGGTGGGDLKNIVSQISSLPQTMKNIFPETINCVGEFIGAGIYSLIIVFGVVFAVGGIIASLLISIVYISNYYIFRSLLFSYLPGVATVSNGQYPSEYSAIMTSSGVSLYLIYFFGTMILTYLIFKKVGLYKRVQSVVGRGR